MAIFGFGGKKKKTASAKKTTKPAKKVSSAKERWWTVYVGNESDGLFRFADVKETSASAAIANIPQGVKDEAKKNRQKLYAFDRETKAVK